MKEHFPKLFDYERWADAKIIDALRQISATDEKSIELFAHVVVSREAWLDRILNGMNAFSDWKERDFESGAKAAGENLNDWKRFLEDADEQDLNEIISYKNMKGEPFKTSVKDIMTHVVNHSTHHRGQIVLRLKDRIASLPTDYIFYTREI